MEVLATQQIPWNEGFRLGAIERSFISVVLVISPSWLDFLAPVLGILSWFHLPGSRGIVGTWSATLGLRWQRFVEGKLCGNDDMGAQLAKL